MDRNSLDKRLKELNIDITPDHEKLELYFKLLEERNEKIDLTNIIEKDEVYLKHFLDSLTLFQIPEFSESNSVVDVGTGAGFPGIPIKLTNDNLDITLLDSLNKRLVFLDEVIDKLQLQNIRTIHGRSENAGNDKAFREQYDIATSRAVSRLNKLSEMVLPLVKVGGIFVAMKGKDIEEELEESKSAIKELGGQIREVIEFSLIDDDHQRSLVVIEKIKATPSKYPRQFGKIKNKPL